MNTNLKDKLIQALLAEHQFNESRSSRKMRQDATKAQAAKRESMKKGKKKQIKTGDLDPHKKDEYKGKFSRDSFHAIMDPDNDQWLNTLGTKDE